MVNKFQNERKRKLYDALTLCSFAFSKFNINEGHELFLLDLATNFINGVAKESLRELEQVVISANKEIMNIPDARPYALRIDHLIKDYEGIPSDDPIQDKPLELFDSSVEPEKYEYLWYPYLVRNNLNCMFGSGGAGKGFVCALIAKHIMTGAEFPNGEQIEPGSVLLYTAEEEANKATDKYIRCGISKAVTDKKFYVIDKMRIKAYADRYGTDTEYPLRSVIQRIPDLKLIIIDPIENFLPSNINANSRADVSCFLSGLSATCAENNVTILYIVHENKKEGAGGGSTNNKAAGSGSFIDVPRSAIQVCCEPAEDGSLIHYVVHTKHNTTGEGAAYKFNITDSSVEWDGVIDRSKADLDFARSKGQSVSEIKKSAKSKAELNDRLIHAVCSVARRELERSGGSTKNFKVSYKDFALEYGENGDVWNGQKPSKALESVSETLHKYGVVIVGTNVNAKWSKDADGTQHSDKGFNISVIDTVTLNKYFSNDIGIGF